jgi:amidophosphoribosyltransferase
MPSSQSQRNLIAHMKLIPIYDLIENKKLLLIDDSIVRGTQLRETVEFLYDAGVKEVHVRLACPPIMYGCKYLNFSRSNSDLELIARKTICELEGTNNVPKEVIDQYIEWDHPKHKALIEEISKKMNFTSLRYYRIDDLYKAIGLNECELCTYCFNGKE